jgi:Tol biopolymer transport system component
MILRKVGIVGGAMLLIFILGIGCSRKDHLQVGADALKKGEFLKAVKELTKAQTQDTLNPDIYYNLCVAYAQLDSAKKALTNYAQLDRLNSPRKDDANLKLLVIKFLKLDPYAASPITIRGMANLFKGAPSPDGELVAVAAARSFLSDIYLVKYDGKVIRKITSGYMNNDPDFSPSGEHIIYVSDRDGDEELYLYDMKTQKTDQITDNKFVDFAPSFSPNGIEAVFVSNRDGNWEIYKINVHNQRAARLTNNKVWDGFPDYTPDGKYIVFSSKRGASEDIFSMKEDGSDEKLMYGTAAEENDPHLNQDDLYFKTTRDGDWKIYRYDMKNKVLTRLTNNDNPNWNIRVSKDGSKLLYARNTRNRWQLNFINLLMPIPSGVIAEAANDTTKIVGNKPVGSK